MNGCNTLTRYKRDSESTTSSTSGRCTPRPMSTSSKLFSLHFIAEIGQRFAKVRPRSHAAVINDLAKYTRKISKTTPRAFQHKLTLNAKVSVEPQHCYPFVFASPECDGVYKSHRKNIVREADIKPQWANKARLTSITGTSLQLFASKSSG